MHKDLSLNMNVKKDTQGILVTLSLKNISEKDIYLKNDVILLDGFTSNKFMISGPAHYKCSAPEMKYYPEGFLIKPQEEKYKELNLSKICTPITSEGGIHVVAFSTYGQACSDPEMERCSSSFELSGESAFILESE